MLRLLLDEHVFPAVAEELPRHRPGLDVVALQAFEGGAYRGVPDGEILQAAAARGLTLVTYDQRTIRPLLKTWAEASLSHRGVLFLNRNAIEPGDAGGLIRALCQLFDACAGFDWTDRVVYLSKTG